MRPSSHFCAAHKEGKTEITQFTICYTIIIIIIIIWHYNPLWYSNKTTNQMHTQL
jgi:hypothetical protein